MELLQLILQLEDGNSGRSSVGCGRLRRRRFNRRLQLEMSESKVDYALCDAYQ